MKDAVLTLLILLGKVILFFVLSLIFLPAFVIVQYGQSHWTKMLNELFGF